MKQSIISRLEFLGRKHGTHQVFDDLLQMGVCSLALGTYEDEYFKRIKRYDKEELNEFPKLFGEICLLFKEKLNSDYWCDFLGEILEEIGLSNQRNGQFLTPVAICNLMALMQDDLSGKTVLDPAVGTGRTLLATLASGNGKPKYFEGIDIDLRGCNISAINMYFHGMSGRIIWGDSLNLTTLRVYEINMDSNIPIKVIDSSNYLFEQQESMKSTSTVPNPMVMGSFEHLEFGDLFN